MSEHAPSSTPFMTLNFEARKALARVIRFPPHLRQQKLIAKSLDVVVTHPFAISEKHMTDTPTPRSTDNATLSLILDRLERIENNRTASSANPTASGSYHRQASDESGSPEPYSPRARDRSSHSASPLSPPSRADARNTPYHERDILPSLRPHGSEGSRHPAVLDVAATLGDTFDRVREQRLRRTMGHNTMATEGIDISLEKARTWIHNYFTYSPTETFLSLVDRKTVELIPDMLLMRHVTIDPCILIIYYVILWRGCYILNTRSYHSPDGRYARKLYLCCLRTMPCWQKEATGSITDFIAAIFMTGIAAESYDFEMSLELHQLACEYAKGLQMHSLDSNDYFVATGCPSTDEDRKGMWELIQTDLFYHLIYNKPATLYPSLDKWQVNLPWLSLDLPPEEGAQVSTISFLFRSRLAFILIRFFQTLEGLENESEAVAAIEPLCHEIEVLFDEWGIEDWIGRSGDNHMDLWMLAGLVLTGYTSIIFMLRKATLLNSNCPVPVCTDNNVPRTDFSTRASRRILNLTYNMLHIWKFPAAEAISYILGAYRAHTAYAHLASNAMNAPSPGDVIEDLHLLDRVAQGIETATQQESDFLPLAREMKRINAQVKERVNGTTSARNA
ncbi:hypothetical protein CPAR01_05328 [Colletotrichum paranaense]|uniref:Transcription factor domain-containing protein n=1 Tax=Colletotrichum paranaense TaxID=1914294 RepID=A0ABQ9SSH5_9PEZI|nr:uncharacterized protein CPAR01_05328 [Colletotrichum paranaense]KAK1541941.1 hypothetical protein CPAR01_05328 [Colletotrichum paranaense]